MRNLDFARTVRILLSCSVACALHVGDTKIALASQDRFVCIGKIAAIAGCRSTGTSRIRGDAVRVRIILAKMA
jgi:hypothetical protein